MRPPARSARAPPSQVAAAAATATPASQGVREPAKSIIPALPAREGVRRYSIRRKGINRRGNVGPRPGRAP